jgi:RNA polymerase sigma factor (sigma-70 family)
MGRIELDDDELERILALAESESTAAQLGDAMDALPRDQRAALNARVLEEQGYDAIARSSGTAEATVRKRVSRALDSLRNALGEKR